jgi:hypothetical protein
MTSHVKGLICNILNFAVLQTDGFKVSWIFRALPNK